MGLGDNGLIVLLKSKDQIKVIIDFFMKNIVNDSLGKICNAHVVLADLSDCGALDQRCAKLTELAAKVVDFPKTGNYKSNKIIGKLHRQIKVTNSTELQIQLSHILSPRFNFKPTIGTSRQECSRLDAAYKLRQCITQDQEESERLGGKMQDLEQKVQDVKDALCLRSKRSVLEIQMTIFMGEKSCGFRQFIGTAVLKARSSPVAARSSPVPKIAEASCSSPGSSRGLEANCSNCKHLMLKISLLQAKLDLARGLDCRLDELLVDSDGLLLA